MKRRTILSILFLIGLVGQAHARPVEGSDPHQDSRIAVPQTAPSETTTWGKLTTKVSSWMARWQKPQAASPERKIASTEMPSATESVPTTVVGPGLEKPDGAPAQVSLSQAAPVHTKPAVSAQEMQDFKAKALVTASAGHAGDKALKRAASGVPIFDLMQAPSGKKSKGSSLAKVKVSSIPLLDIGEEATVSHNDLILPKIMLEAVRLSTIEKLKNPMMMSEPDLKKVLAVNYTRALAPQKLTLSFLEGEDVVTRRRIDAVKYTVGSETPVTELALSKLSAEDMLALRALLLVEKKDSCHLATGLFYSLLDAKSETYRTQANLHLGLCLHEMGLFTESVKRLSEVIKKGDRAFIPMAVEKLVRDLPQEFESEVYKIMKDMDASLVYEKAKDDFNYVMAKGASSSDEFKAAANYASKVSSGSPKYDKAQYIWAVAEYATGKTKESLDRQKALLTKIESSKDTNLQALIAMNLGRTSFQMKNFDEAAQYYMRIKKDNPFWVQALTEQGWAQLQKSDPEGAIGNMYSIHSPYFKAVYKPESYVVRTIGYLNICQYGDAYRTLSQLEMQYRPWHDLMKTYLERNPQPTVMYNGLVQYLKLPSQTAVDGLPAQVWREMGRNRDFLNLQAAINNRVDELEQYNFLNALIDKDKDKVKWKLGKAHGRITDNELNLKRAEKDSNLVKNINEWKAQIGVDRELAEFYYFQMGVYEEGRRGMQKFKEVARARLVQTKEGLKASAGKVLKTRLKTLEKELTGILDNNELLRYEVFAGSGENIRFQLAAGEKPEVGAAETRGEGHRVPANVKPKSKELQWAFDGEYWEDEIGNYRSSLKNNCPKGTPSAANR